MSLVSIAVEKHALAGLFQNPEVLADVDGFLSEKDFYIEPHNVIFSCLRNLILANERPDKVLLAQKIKNLGISFKENIDIFSYLEAITFAPITAKATSEACKELRSLRYLRDLESTGEAIKKHVNKSVGNPLEQTIGEVDEIYGKTIDSFTFQDAPQSLFETLYEDVESRGNAPIEEQGLATPYPEFNRLFGGLLPGNVYAVASRAGQGKSTFLMETASEIGKAYKIPILYLDSEMTFEEQKFRMASSKSGVPLWYLSTGNFRRNQEYVDKVRSTLKNIKNEYNVYHYHVGGKGIDEVCAIIRRWIMSVGCRNKQFLVVFDYVKITGSDKLSNFNQEYHAVGTIVDKLKRVSVEFQFPLLTAIQLNRSGEGKQSSDVTDDSSAIATSDRLLWYTTFLAILRKRTADEILEDGLESGSHKMIPIKARHMGREAQGYNDFIQRTYPDGQKKYVRNFLNFHLDSFRVEERGSLVHCIERQNKIFKLEDPKGDDLTL